MAANLDPIVEHETAGLEQFVTSYRRLPGIFDEMMDGDGRVRAHWRPFLGMLASLGAEEINRRFAAADRYLRGSGVFYRVYEDAAGIERPWPLSHVPLIIEPGEWRQLEAGLIQRAELLEAVLADAYGPSLLSRDGRLPAALIAGNPEFLRPLVGVAPPGGAHLRFYAVDVGRGADGRWWVLGDRAQAPSGAGYAIENRLALSRAIPDIYRTTRVERVAPFFQAFQAELSALSRQDEAHLCLLTPGPMSETYFEHAYLARYLGLMLVEGEDLSVRDDGVFVRTVSGLQRTEVLLRRIDADFADPLELNAASRLGAPGLLQAVRDGKIVIINALGAGLVEARAMLAFLPALAPVVLGADLAIPNVATWWLGRAEMREEMIEKLDSMVVASAFESPVDGRGSSEFLGAKLDDAERRALILSIRDRGVDYVAQEAVTLSSMPVWRDGRLQPRPFTLRLFLTKVGDRWQMMPGGFVRIAESADARAVSMQRGAATADAWVLAHGPVAETTLLPTAERIQVQRATGLLPSRAADNLFWVGRYVERAEATLRLIRTMINRAAEADETTAPVIAGISSLLAAWNAAPDQTGGVSAATAARAVLTRADLAGSLPDLAGAARSAASVIRDRFSPDAWRAINDLFMINAMPLSAGPDRKRHYRARRSVIADHLIAFRAGAGKHDATRWLAFPRTRPAHRARDHHRPPGALLRAPRRARRWPRRASRACRQPDHLSAALLHGRGARTGHRPGHARSEQSALGGVSARPDRNASRCVTGASCRRPSFAGAADRGCDCDAAAYDRGGCDRRGAHRRNRTIVDETFRRNRRNLSHQQRALRIRVGGAGVIYDVRQTTTCVYASPVAHAHHVLRLMPINRPGQRVHVAALQIGPEPAHRREGKDFFGNRLTWIDVEEPHKALSVKLTARVTVDALVEPAPLSSPAWEAVREAAFATSDIGPLSPAHFLFPSRMVSLDPEIRDYTRESFPAERPVLDAAIELMNRLKSDIAYEIGATTVTTTPPMSFALRRGVCQDFAHIMISGLRGIGLPAGYVSGYLRSAPRTDAARLQGSDAMHAWVLVWCGPEIGWIGLDPTNAILASDEHVVLAFGRDYTDVAPMDGVIIGSGRQRIDVGVSVTPV